MSVESILKSKGAAVTTIAPTATVKIAAKMMKENKIGALVVLNQGSIAGLITERDIVHAISDRGGSALSEDVAEFMRSEVVTCRPEDSLKSIMSAMTVHRTRHLPVVKDGKILGMVSIGDAVKQRLADAELETAVLRDAYIARG